MWAKVWPYLVLTAALAGATVVVYNVGYDAAVAKCNSEKSAAKTIVIEKGRQANEVRSNNRALPDGAAGKRLRERWARD